MEHFLPLAIASLVISLISIILLDYFGPTSSSTSDKDALSSTPNDAFENIEEYTKEYTEKRLSEELNKEITVEQNKPFSSNETNQQLIKRQISSPLNLFFKSRFGLPHCKA